MIATAHLTRTATDWVRLEEDRSAILAGSGEQVGVSLSYGEEIVLDWMIDERMIIRRAWEFRLRISMR